MHSPGLVYVPDPGLTDPRVKVRGIRRWFCDVPVEFLEPAQGHRRRVGPYELEIQWPHIIIHADEPVPEPVIIETLGRDDIQWKVKAGRFVGQGLDDSIGSGGGGRGGYGRNRAWCGCVDAPAQGTRKAPEMLQEWRVKASNSAPRNVDDAEWIKLQFHHPVEEPFELASPALKTP